MRIRLQFKATDALHSIPKSDCCGVIKMKWFFLTKQIYEIVKFWCLVSLISLTVHFEQLFEADHLKNVKLWKN